MRWLLSCVFLGMLGCGGAEVGSPPPKPVVVEEDTFETRFARAYFAIACIANAGKDPEMTITPLRRPLDYLESAEKSGRAARALEILKSNGFTSIEAFREAELALKQRQTWWQSTIEARFIDELKACR